MLVLKHAKGEIYNLSLQSEHLIGRLGNLELLNDSSVSRHHACIKVSVKNGKFQVVLEDLGSKYGTYINEGIEQSKEVPKKTGINLKVGDVIRFGQQWNTWRLVKESFVISTSTLTAQEKSFMTKIASKLNGILVSDCNKNCTHLTVNRIKITIKVACALGHVKPIVTVDYWKHLLAALSSKEETVLPDYVNFIPSLEEPLLDANHFDFKMKSERRTLFENVKFIAFGSAQVNSVLPMIEAAGGTVIDGKIFKLSKEQLLNDKIVVIQPKNDEIAAAKAYQDILSAHRLRTVPELEIGLSIASCSLDLYCNPAYDVSVLFKQPTTQTVKDDATILAIGTQDIEDDDTEYQEDPCGSNFSLTVNDKNQEFSESEDDELNDTDRSVIEDSAELVSSSRSSKLSMKRKSEETKEKPAKNSRLDDYLTRSKRTTSSSCNNSESLLSGQTVSRKPIRDLFSFDIDNRKINKNSSSLFEGINEHAKDTCKNISEKRNSSEQSTCSFVFDSQCRGTEESSTSITTRTNVQQTKRSTKSLFDGLNASEKESPALFSSDSGKKVELKVMIEDKPERSNKRKFVDSFDIPASKTANKRTKSLFELSSSKNKKTEATPVVSSEDDPDSILEQRTKKLNISKVTKTAPSMPVVNVPTTVSLSQFVDVSVNKVHVKTEPLDLPTQVRDILNTTVVHVAPLTMNSPTSVKENKCFEVNFKKFRKGQYRKSSVIIPPTALRIYIPELENGYNED